MRDVNRRPRLVRFAAILLLVAVAVVVFEPLVQAFIPALLLAFVVALLVRSF